MLALVYGILLSITTPEHALADPTFLPADTVKRSGKTKQIVSDSITYIGINRIIILGNRRTLEKIILRELSFKKGDVVSEFDLPHFLEKDQRKLFNLHLFNTVTLKPLDLKNGYVDLLVEVDERWYTFPIPTFRLSDRNFNEWWENYDHDFDRVVYGLKLYQYNVFGLNQTLILTTHFGFQRHFELLYRIPYIDKKQKQGLIFQADYIDAKNVPDSTLNHKLDFLRAKNVVRHTHGLGLTYTYRKNFYEQHRIRYEYRKTTITDTLETLNPNYLGVANRKQIFDALSYQFISDHRDVIAYPLRGYHLLAHIQQTGVAINKDIKKTDGILSFAGFLDLKKNFFLANLSYLYLSTPDNLPYFNYGSMGYDKIFVRGYEVYVIEGPRYFLNKTTLKKRIFSKAWTVDRFPIPRFNYFPLAIYLKTYADFGYVDNYPAYSRNSLNTMLSDKVIGGGGFGIDFVMAYDVVFRLEYTFTTQKTDGFFLHIKKEF